MLFLNQKSQHEIHPAAADDIAVNFIILPEFFDYVLKMIGEEKNLLRDFVIDCLTGENENAGYMLFKVAGILPISNLTENHNGRLLIDVYSYIEENYRDGELTKLARLLNYDVYWLSKEIKKRIGRSYTELVQEKRLNQAAYLLCHTGMSVMDIGLAVGYDNMSYFHRIFRKQFGMTPRKYRMNN